jgi:hypothetical protein
MDLGTCLVGIVMLSACIIPFVLMAQNRKKREAQMLFSLKKIAEGEMSEVTKYEICCNSIIGLDENNFKLFYYHKGTHKEKRMIVDLTKVISCKAERIVNTLSDGSQSIKKLPLVFWTC